MAKYFASNSELSDALFARYLDANVFVGMSDVHSRSQALSTEHQPDFGQNIRDHHLTVIETNEIQDTVDLRLNHMWTPVLEIQTLATIHFGTILPKLRSLVPKNASYPTIKLPHLSLADTTYSRSYLRLLIVALTNNLSGLEQLPVQSILDYMRTRFTTKDIAKYLDSLPLAISRAFGEGLLRCAVTAGDASVVSFMLLHGDSKFDTNEFVGFQGGHRATLLEHTARQEDVAVARVLIKYGADVNKTLSKHHRGPPLYEILRRCPKRLDYVSLLLDAGADVSCNIMLRALQTARWHDCSLVVEQLLLHGAPSAWSKWERNLVFLLAMVRLPHHSRQRIAKIILQYDIDLDFEIPQEILRHNFLLSEAPYPARVIDAAAKKGDLQLLKMLSETGATLTEDTLPFAIRSGNCGLVQYLLLQTEISTCLTASDKVCEALKSTTSEVLSLLEQCNAYSKICQDWRYVTMIGSASDRNDVEETRELLKALSIHQQTPTVANGEQNFQLSYALGRHLVRAIRAGKEEVAYILIDGGAYLSGYSGSKLDGDDIKYATPLSAALEAENAGLVRALLDAGADPAFLQRYGIELREQWISPLQLAAKWGEVSVIKDLIYAGADVNETPFVGFHDLSPASSSALTIAVESKNLKLAKFLLQEGADASIFNGLKRETTPLTAALKNRDHDMIQVLLLYGANPADSAALMEAIGNDTPEFVEHLLQYFIERYPKGKPGYGSDAIQTVIRKGRFDLMRLLIDANVDIWHMREDDFMGDFSEAALATAIKAEDWIRREAVPLLIQKGAGANSIVARSRFWHSKIDCGRAPRHTPLLEAIRANSLATVQILLDYGADVNWPARRGIQRTPLQYASELGNMDIVHLLLKNNASVNDNPADRGGATALQLAAIEGYVGIAELLLTSGADINAEGAKINGRCAIDGAAEHGRFNMVDLLLQKGAGSYLTGLKGECQAITLARRNGHVAVAQLIQSHLDAALTSSGSIHSVPSGRRESIEQRPICKLCHASFKNQSSLARHRRTKHFTATMGENLTHECSVCKRTFQRRDMLTRHLSTHTKAMHIRCPTCKKYFRKDYFKSCHLDESGRCNKARLTTTN